MLHTSCSLRWGITMGKVVTFKKKKKSYLTFCDPVDSSPPGSSAHGILQARIQECVAIPFSNVSSRPRDPTSLSCIASRFLYCLSHQGSNWDNEGFHISQRSTACESDTRKGPITRHQLTSQFFAENNCPVSSLGLMITIFMYVSIIGKIMSFAFLLNNTIKFCMLINS